MVGCTYTITYSVTGTGGSASDSIVVRINAAAPTCSYTTYWSSCNASCGGGTRYEYYNNVTGSCPATTKNDWPTGATQACNTQACTYNLTVSRAGAGTGSVGGPGIACGADCFETYSAGTSVTLTATPSGGSVFSGWSGSCGGSASCVLSMTNNRAVTATFAPPGLPTVDIVAVTPAITVGQNATFSWTPTSGTAVSCRLFWNGTPVGNPGNGMQNMWPVSGSVGVQTPQAGTHTMTADCQNASGTSGPSDSALVTVSPAGPAAPAVVITPTTSETITLGQSVTYTVSASDGDSTLTNLNFDFRGPLNQWNFSGDGQGSASVVTTSFAPTNFSSFTTTFTPSAVGTYTVRGAAADPTVWTHSSERTITVTAGSGDPECSDGVDNSDPEDTLADYPSDPGCSDANDDDETNGGGGCATPPCGGGGGPNPLFVTVVGNGSVSSNPAGINGCTGTCSTGYADGTVVTLTATPGSGDTFSDWSDDCSGTGGCSVTMNGQRNVTATFSDNACVTPSCGGGTGAGGGMNPTITADPRLVKSGEKTTLTWTLDGGVNCTLAGGGLNQSVSIDSSQEVTVRATTKYTVSCPSGGTASIWVYIDGFGHET